MKKIIKIFLIAAIIITIVIIGLNLLLNKKNTSKISSNVYKPTQIEDWRINDINTYEYIFSEIISQFNDGYLDDVICKRLPYKNMSIEEVKEAYLKDHPEE